MVVGLRQLVKAPFEEKNTDGEKEGDDDKEPSKKKQKTARPTPRNEKKKCQCGTEYHYKGHMVNSHGTTWAQCNVCIRSNKKSFVHYNCCGWNCCVGGCGVVVCRLHLGQRIHRNDCEDCRRPWLPILYVKPLHVVEANVPLVAINVQINKVQDVD